MTESEISLSQKNMRNETIISIELEPEPKENEDEQLEQEDEETLGLLGEPDEEW